MRVVIQRVKNACIEIDGRLHTEIGKGLLILLGIEEADNIEDIDWLCKKTVNLRIFGDNEGKMNLSVKDVDGEILVVSQFTLHASTKKGNRPSFARAAIPEKAIPLYEKFIESISKELNKEAKSGVFGANMSVSLVNDGPVTIYIDTKNKE